MIHAGSSADLFPNGFGQFLAQSLQENPDEIAFRFAGETLRRHELLDQALGLVHRFEDLDLQRGEPVIVDVPHGFGLAVAMVAVAISGGCAVPLDSVAPLKRREAIKADAHARFEVHLGENAALTISPTPKQKNEVRIDPRLAFIIYTSGSTGGPKGVEITDRNYLSRMRAIAKPRPASDRSIDLAWTPASFIGMLDEFYFPLLTGTPSVIASPDIRADPVAFSNLIEQEQITSFRVTPSLLDLLLSTGFAARLRSVTDIYCSGEPISPELYEKTSKYLKARLWGFYGATEAPGVAYHLFDKHSFDHGQVCYTPQPFVTFKIVQPDGQPVAKGETGEIIVGGDTVSQSYWQNKELSKNSFSTADGVTWYRTGDNGRFLDDGIQIIGRVDRSEQKINGVRVNLDEVTGAMKELPSVTAAWVSVVDPDAIVSQTRLVGHYTAEENAEIESKDIKTELAAFLPFPAIPQTFIRHDSFPLTINGKVDAQSLKEQARVQLTQKSKRQLSPSLDVQTCRPELRALVLELAKEILNTSGLTDDDNFFAAGGNSLLAVQFALGLSDRLAADISSSLVFKAGSFLELAQLISDDAEPAMASLRLLRAGTSTDKQVFTINSTGEYAKLTKHFDANLSIQNLNIFGLTLALQDRLKSYELKEIAEYFAKEILKEQPDGPWPLVAYCQDGCLAVETARVLKERTGKPAELLLIDTFFTDHRKTVAMRFRDLGWKLSGLMRRRKNRTTTPQTSIEPRQLSKKQQFDVELRRRFEEHFMHYKPEPVDAAVTLFVSSEWRGVRLDMVRAMASNGLNLRYVDGRHNELFAEENAPKLVSALESALSNT